MRKNILAIIFPLLTLLVIAGLGLVAYGQETQTAPVKPDGKAIFLNQKCNQCHSIESAAVEMTVGGYQKSKERNVPPDLSGIGLKHNAEWISKYVTRKETVEGLTHAKLFRGNEEELQTLAKWLETLK